MDIITYNEQSALPSRAVHLNVLTNKKIYSYENFSNEIRKKIASGPCETRTRDLLRARQVLYQTELRALYNIITSSD